MGDRRRASGLVYALGVLCAAAIVTAFLVVGPAEDSAARGSRVVTASEGVVQSTVSGSGNLQAASQLDLGFKTAGVVRRIDVTEGQHVTAGQLLAELDPRTAEVSLEQSRATLRSAEASLAQLEETGGETTSGTAAAGKSASATAATTSTATTPASTAPASTAPAHSAPAPGTPATSPSSGSTTSTSSGAGSAAHGTPAASSEAAKQSPATREANLASARASVSSARLAVESAEQSVADTKLDAPQAGTIVSLSGEVGETVSATGNSKSTTTPSSGSSGGSGAGGTGGAGGARASTSSASTSSSGGGTTSTAFAVLSDLSAMQLVVPLSESEIVHVHVGQPATVTVEALEGVKLAARVASVALLATSNSGVVSYDVTFQLDQMASGLRPGMSASAEVVVQQQEGVNVPTSAISGGSVTVLEGTRQVRRRVVTGLTGTSTTIIHSGLHAGERVVVPLASSSGATSVLSRLSRGGGLGGRGGGLGGGLPLGGGAFLRGGGG
jgi:multidrug efflux pump subunit AcrA (membrane-fusion protein)